MPSKLVQDIYDFNDKAGFLGNGMDSFVESAYIFEEALEGYEDVMNNPNDPEAPIVTPRNWSLSLLNAIKDAKEQRGLPMPEEVDELDKAIDLCVFSIGKMAKLGLSPEQIDEAFSIVAKANLSKIGAPKDVHGKQLKPEGWEAPEPQLQALLDRRANPIEK
jgi:hypothetical protein